MNQENNFDEDELRNEESRLRSWRPIPASIDWNLVASQARQAEPVQLASSPMPAPTVPIVLPATSTRGLLVPVLASWIFGAIVGASFVFWQLGTGGSLSNPQVVTQPPSVNSDTMPSVVAAMTSDVPTIPASIDSLLAQSPIHWIDEEALTVRPKFDGRYVSKPSSLIDHSSDGRSSISVSEAPSSFDNTPPQRWTPMERKRLFEELLGEGT